MAKINIVLEDKPDKGQIPVEHISRITRASDDKPPPKPVQITREALRAWSESIPMIYKIRNAKMFQDLSYAGIVREAMAMTIRFHEYKTKKNGGDK